MAHEVDESLGGALAVINHNGVYLTAMAGARQLLRCKKRSRKQEKKKQKKKKKKL